MPGTRPGMTRPIVRSPGRVPMHIIAFMVALVASAPAAAQSWQEYSYPDFSFAVAFPAEPKIETTSYRAPDGRAVDARVYSVVQANAVFKMTVADVAADMDDNAVIDHAVKALSPAGEVKVDIPHRIYRVYGRQL